MSTVRAPFVILPWPGPVTPLPPPPGGDVGTPPVPPNGNTGIVPPYLRK